MISDGRRRSGRFRRRCLRHMDRPIPDSHTDRMTDMMNQIEKAPSQGHEASNISLSRAEGVDPSVTEHACDVLVIGSGAGGLSTAVAAAHRGLDVLVVEKEPVFGGTTARSGGWMWIPNNAPAKRAGVDDSVEKARTYLIHETGEHFDAA